MARPSRSDEIQPLVEERAHCRSRRRSRALRTTTPSRGLRRPYGEHVPAVPELDLARIRRYCDAKVPLNLRDEARIEADVRGKSVTIFECRPPWHPNLTDWSRVPVAQLRYASGDNIWTLYWADRNARWHRYPETDPGTVQQLLDEIDHDQTGVFWG